MPSSVARKHMLESQITTGNVLSEPVLEALGSVARERFVPVSLRNVAYVDDSLPLGHNRHLLSPLAFAKMLERAAITPQDTVLNIACAFGYSAAVLAKLARRVVAVESIDAFAEQARKSLANYGNVSICSATLTGGEHTQAPYDIILIEGAIEHLPQAIADQVREGGRILAFEPVGSARPGTAGLCNLVEYKKLHGTLYRTVVCNSAAAVLGEFKAPATFAL